MCVRDVCEGETSGGDVDSCSCVNSLTNKGGADIETLAVGSKREVSGSIGDVSQPGGWPDIIDGLGIPVEQFQIHLTIRMNEGEIDEKGLKTGI